MSNVTYVFGDMLTGKVLQEIPLQGVSMTRGFGQGDFRGTFHLDISGKSNRDLLAATEEGRSFVICERDATPIWGGFVWTRTYQSQAKSYQLYCKAFEHYPEFRDVRTTFTNTNVEQRNIFRNLWTAMMADPNSLQVTLPSAFPDAVLKTLTVNNFEFKTYRQGMDSIANGDNGFDWTIDVARVGGAYTKTLRIGYPTLGATLPTTFYYPGEILNYWQNGSMSGRGTNVFGLGAGEGSTMLTQEVIHSDLLAGGFPRYDVNVSLKDINSGAILTTLTTQAAIIRKAGKATITAELKGDLEPEFGSYGLGDSVKIYFKDPAHVDPASQVFSSRVLGWEYYPPSNEHVEYARLIFEGEDI